MRSDYILYVFAVICFILAVVVFAGYPPMGDINLVATAVLAILGMILVGAGYLIRPEETTLAPPTPPAPKPPPKISAPPQIPQPKKAVTSPIDITKIKGIGPKRAEQLRTLGINTAQDLAETTATTLAAKTELSPKITSGWIREAKRLVKKAS
ncbi:MAG: helix-hairpin-helix domain-containing protein [Candidatus Bathyarchaeia archaeon]